MSGIEDVDVAVLGAGPAGLTAAYELTKAGRSTCVIEKDETYVGGISRTVEHEGYRFDIGGHRFFSKSKEVVALWDELLPDDFIERPRMSRIYYGGKYYSYPLRAFEALGNLGLLRSTACMLSYLRWKTFPKRNVESFQDWVVNNFGKELFDTFFKTYTEKVWGMGCDEISADWAAQRIKGLSLGGAVIDGVKRSFGLGRVPNDGMTAKTLLESFRYPRLGPGMMWEAARDRVVEGGNAVMMGHALETLHHEDGIWTITTSSSEGSATIRARDVVSSVPMRELAERLTPELAARDEAAGLRYRDFLTVAVMCESKDLFPDNWIYIHDPAVKVGRIQNFRSWSPELIPREDMACVGLEYFCFEGDGLWTSPDEDLVALAKKELAQLGLCRPETVESGVVVRQEKAYPVYDDEYVRNVTALREELEHRFPSLHLVGRNGMHKYNNQDHAMMTAMLTVRNILAGERVHDVWLVNEDAEYHEAGQEGAVEALRSERMVPKRLERAA